MLAVDGVGLSEVRIHRAGIFLLGDWKRFGRRWFSNSNTDAFGQRVRPMVFADGHGHYSQTQAMYRSCLVRGQEAFYNISFPFADVQKSIEILGHCDSGFVYQVLSFTRKDNESILHQVLLPMAAYPLAQYVIAQRYGAVFLGVNESAFVIAKYKLQYYSALARAALRLRGRAF
jgi:hypothetical protein